jgi:hypothetical protein
MASEAGGKCSASKYIREIYKAASAFQACRSLDSISAYYSLIKHPCGVAFTMHGSTEDSVCAGCAGVF